jgi:hypothetical protein
MPRSEKRNPSQQIHRRAQTFIGKLQVSIRLPTHGASLPRRVQLSPKAGAGNSTEVLDPAQARRAYA